MVALHCEAWVVRDGFLKEGALKQTRKDREGLDV